VGGENGVDKGGRKEGLDVGEEDGAVGRERVGGVGGLVARDAREFGALAAVHEAA
jgi:hypothetical protein